MVTPLKTRVRSETMKGTSKVILGATLIMVISLAIVLGLVLVLLAELYCSLLRRRRLKPNSNVTTTTTTTTTATVEVEESSASRSPLSSFYSHGVLQAPRDFLFPRVMMIPSDKEGNGNEGDLEMQQHGKLHQLLNFQTTGLGMKEYYSTKCTESVHHHRRSTESDYYSDVDLEVEGSPSPSYIMNSSLPPHHHQSWLKSGLKENVVYVSNPIYDNSINDDCVIEESGKVLPRWSVMEEEEDTPPFETPETSPTRVDTSDKEAEKKIRSEMLSSTRISSSLTVTVKTPPLSPIKDLPAKAVSVVLRDARCLLGTSGSESNSNSQNAGTGTYSMSSGSPRTSPSW